MFAITTSHNLKFKPLSQFKDLRFLCLTLSVNLKQRIINLQHDSLIIHDITAQMEVSVSCVYKTLQMYKECGKYMSGWS